MSKENNTLENQRDEARWRLEVYKAAEMSEVLTNAALIHAQESAKNRTDRLSAEITSLKERLEVAAALAEGFEFDSSWRKIPEDPTDEPELADWVLLIGYAKIAEIGRWEVYKTGKHKMLWNVRHGYHRRTVFSHWRPIPEPPK